MGCHRGSGAFRTWTRTRIRFGLGAFRNQVMATMNLLAIFLFLRPIWCCSFFKKNLAENGETKYLLSSDSVQESTP
jgi:hypothetical protein